jgi:class 3 adenylate cyclase
VSISRHLGTTTGPGSAEASRFGGRSEFTSIRQWLDFVGLGRYAAAFEENAIDWDVLSNLDQNNLKEIGVRAAGDRIRILNAIQLLDAKDEKAIAPFLSATSPQYSPSGGAELRQLTVMFCDLVDSTALAHRLDPEDFRELLSAFQKACESPIKRYNGTVARYGGDSVMAYFGYPEAQEENAERAVRAGLAVIDEMTQLNTRLAQRPAVRLHIRIGIATGPVVVGDIIGEGTSQENAAVGETLHVAARLQELAQPNTVVISSETRRLALGYFEYKDLGEKQLKGLSTPLRVWQVLAERAAKGRFEARHAFGLTSLVGRAEELALILRMWEDAKEGAGHVVLLSGEPGIGKSRLAQAFRERISEEPHTLIRYHCSPYHSNSALYPIIEQFRQAWELDIADDTDTKIAKIEAALEATFNDVSTVAPLFAALLSIDVQDRYPASRHTPEALKDATRRALASQLASAAAHQPVILIIEDVQWIDPSSQEVLDLLLPNIRDQSVLVVITYRPEFQPKWSGLAHALTLPLGRLPRREVEWMTEKVCGGKPLPKAVLDLIIAKADGIPLFVEELTKAILESAALVESGDTYRLNGALPEQLIPTTLQDSLMARLDRAAPMREVAQVGSCIGREFSLELLATVLGVEKGTLAEALGQLEDAGLLVCTKLQNNINYTFKHALIQDAAYRSLLKSRRKLFHARIADNLRDFGNIVASAPETLARHYTEAANFEEAATYWRLAAERDGARYANAEAIEHCRNGLAALAHMPAGANHTNMELAFRIALANGLRVINYYGEALAQLVAAETTAAENNRPLELSRIHHLRGNIYYPLGKISNCFTEHKAAWQYAKKVESIEDEARALGGLGDAHFLAGRIRLAHEHFEECVTLTRANGLILTEVAYLPMRAVTHMYSLRYHESLDDCRSVIELLTTTGQARGELISRNTSSWIHLDQGDLAQAEEHARKGLEAVERVGARSFVPLFNDVIARIRLQTGDRTGAIELLDESWKLSRETGVTFVGPVVLGAIAMATTDPGRRQEALHQGEAILNDGCASHNYFRFYRDAIEVSLRQQAWDKTDTYANALERYCGANRSPWPDFFIAQGRALAEAGRRGSGETIVARLKQPSDLTSNRGAPVPAVHREM